MRLCRRLLALFCVVAALNFGLSSLGAGVVELHHYVHGDEAVSDGGWIITDAHDGDHHDVDADAGHTDADGHHHHAGADHGATGLPATVQVASLPSLGAVERPTLVHRLDDADPGVSGPVPRDLIRIV